MSNLVTQKPNGSKTALPETRTLFDRLFDDPFFRWPIASALASNVREYIQPEMDLYEKDGQYVVELAVPGMRKEDFSIEVVGNRLTVSGTRTEEKKDEGSRYHYREVRRGEFTRSVEFPLDIDENNVKASYEGGILKIALKPLKAIAAKKIAVQ